MLEEIFIVTPHLSNFQVNVSRKSNIPLPQKWLSTYRMIFTEMSNAHKRAPMLREMST